MEIKQGLTWISDVGNVFRVLEVLDSERCKVARLGIVDQQGKPVRRFDTPDTYTFPIAGLTHPAWRIAAHVPERFDAWFAAEVG